MQLSYTLLLTAALQYVSAQEATDMGPAAILWPPDRTWGASSDNTAPCGSVDGVTNRTQFPLTGGSIALVMQDESYTINIGISYNSNPTSNSDFTTLISSKYIPELEPGHECYPLPDASGIGAGSNATLQIQYVSEFDTTVNQTFYACSDITYVLASDFTTSIPCFNVSIDDLTGSATSSASTATATATASTAASTSATGTSAASSLDKSSGSSGLSKGAIAGIVVGAVVGSAAILGALFFLYRRHTQKVQREQAAHLRMINLTNAPKNTGSLTTNE